VTPAKLAAEAVWSREAVRLTLDRIHAFRPEVVHFHNLFPGVSPAVISTASGRGIPTVMTLHNFRLMCLPATLLRDGKICESCVGSVPWRGVVHRCYRDSLPASAALGLSIALHRGPLRTFEGVTLFATVSDFIRRKYVDAGFPKDRFFVKPNFSGVQERRAGPGEYFLYVGRLAAEKGIVDLVRSWPCCLSLKIAGDGPELERLKSVAPPNVELLGAVDTEGIPALIRGSRAVLVPSVWYEGQPRVVLEAFATGVPIVASDLGGLSELVTNGFNGLLVRPGDMDGWLAAVRDLSDDQRSEALGDGAWRIWRDRFTPELGLVGLEETYARAAAIRRGAKYGERPRWSFGRAAGHSTRGRDT
jgi:glycosyltransferase involved in cell wall biosynthesis